MILSGGEERNREPALFRKVMPEGDVRRLCVQKPETNENLSEEDPKSSFRRM
jgi:hypothetical protein